MRAETFLRLGEYSAAFGCFKQVYEDSLRIAREAAAGDREVAPFRLLHDAECIDHAVALGADPSHLSTSQAWRELAADLITQVVRDSMVWASRSRR